MGICASNPLFSNKRDVIVNGEEQRQLKDPNKLVLSVNNQDNSYHQRMTSDITNGNVHIFYIINIASPPEKVDKNIAKSNKQTSSNTLINQITTTCVDPLSIKEQTTINIIILGATKVGKSAFLIKIIENIFEKLYIPTIYVENQSKTVLYNSRQYIFNFTVTATGDYKEDYSSVYNGMNFFLVFYDVTNLSSFKEAQNVYNKELKYKHNHYNYEVSNIFFVGNKVDEITREVSVEMSEEFCLQNKIKLFEISVKTHKNINQMLNLIAQTFDVVAFSSVNK